MEPLTLLSSRRHIDTVVRSALPDAPIDPGPFGLRDRGRSRLARIARATGTGLCALADRLWQPPSSTTRNCAEPPSARVGAAT